MDRLINYAGAVPLETDLLNTNRNTMTAIAKLCAALFGTSQTIVNGLTVTQTGVASMQVQVSAGEIYALVNLDGSAYSSLAADTTHQIVKQGINLDATLLTLTAPGTVGQSVNYLIQATFTETDTGSVVLPYYNASNPSTAYSGPANSGTAQNTKRSNVVTLNAKQGVAAATGSQTTPSPDSGFVGIAVVTVAYGAATVVNANISVYPGAPVLPSSGILVGGLQNNAFAVSQAGGTADAITGTYSPAVTSLKDGMALYVRASLANTSTTPTFTPNSGLIAAKAIVKGAGTALSAADVAGAGHWIELQYDLSLDKWVLLNPANGISALSLASFIGTNQSLASFGYQKLPGGLIIQWGSFSQTGTPLPANGIYSAANQSFPIAFPNACLWMGASSTLNYVMAQAFAVSASQFTPRFSNASASALNVDLQWIAIGR